jgi:acetyl esterase/lipase
MPSKESAAVRDLYRSWRAVSAADPRRSAEDQRTLIESWNVLTAEPGGVDYLEVDAGGIPAMWAVPHGSPAGRVLLALHGGGFISGSMYTHRKLYAHLAKLVGARALIPNYRLLPAGVHPAPVDDVVCVYRWLLDRGTRPGHLAFVGDSAGGWLSIVTQLRARDAGLPLPAAAMLLSPWVDLAVTGESMRSNAGKDALFAEPWVRQMAEAYLHGTSARDPYANPLYADLAGLGPVYVQVGDQELLLDDGRRLADHLDKAGVEVRCDVFAGQQHTFQMMVGRAPEADDAVRRLADWVRPKLGG